mmetsp:Transcript_28734/g.95452  ORF Transcript_28734/g.95452 Transcript_28734/m.95452 type:complete len:323 (-) Transcript_28734:97-1065(-)
MPRPIQWQVWHRVRCRRHAAKNKVEEVKVQMILRIALQEDREIGQRVVVCNDVRQVGRALVSTSPAFVGLRHNHDRCELVCARQDVHLCTLATLLVNQQSGESRNTLQLGGQPTEILPTMCNHQVHAVVESFDDPLESACRELLSCADLVHRLFEGPSRWNRNHEVLLEGRCLFGQLHGFVEMAPPLFRIPPRRRYEVELRNDEVCEDERRRTIHVYQVRPVVLDEPREEEGLHERRAGAVDVVGVELSLKSRDREGVVRAVRRVPGVQPAEFTPAEIHLREAAHRSSLLLAACSKKCQMKVNWSPSLHMEGSSMVRSPLAH